MLPFMLAPLLEAVLLVPPTAYAQGGGGLNGPQIAHIAYTAGEIDIHAAQLALQKSNNPDVHSFAN